MTLLQVAHLSKEYDRRSVWDDLCFTLAAGERVGLVGPNGSGKTTLLRILAGKDGPTSGRVSWVRPDLRLGYLEQKQASPVLGCSGATTALGLVRAAIPSPEDPAARARALAALGKMGLSGTEATLPLAGLSGGQRTRAGLAAALIAEPDVLLLDEPTSNLDVAALEWLEVTLGRFGGAVLAVSHDRYFLDVVATRILELDGGKLRSFPGNYSAHRLEKDRMAAEQAATYRKQKAAAEDLREAIRRERQWFDRAAIGPQYGTPTFKGKYRDRATKHSTRFQAKERRLARLNDEAVAKPWEARGLDLRLGTGRGQRPGRLLLRTRGLAKAYPGRQLFDKADLAVERGSRVAVLGPNGCGKTTLLRVLLGLEEPTSGTVERAGHTTGYFAQEAETLDARRTVYQEIAAALRDGPGGCIPPDAPAPVRPDPDQTTVRGFGAAFLFRGEDIHKAVSQLSSGERGRLALAKLVAKSPDLLVLDEPTNHLDLPAREQVELALERFPGTILLVSHDRYLLRRLADRVWAFTPPAGIISFAGGYEDYQVALRRRAAEAQAPGSGELRARLAVLETRLAVLGARLADPRTAQDKAEMDRTGEEFLAVRREMDDLRRLGEE